jgi:sulfite exporter TauE/SafE
MCGGFAAACSRRPGGLPLWHLGRIGAYAALGALAGAAGVALPGPAWVPALLATALLTWFALMLAGWLPEPRVAPAALIGIGSGLVRSPSRAAHLGFGIANGLLPCGLVYSALALSVASRGAARGALVMAAFGLGTAPLLSLGALGLRRIALTSPGRRRVFAVFVLISGVWFIWARAALADPTAVRSFLRHCTTLFT